MRRSILSTLLCCLFLSACAAPAATVMPTAVGPTITPNPFASPTATPFQPVEDLPTASSLPPPTWTPIPPTLTPPPTDTPIPPSPTETVPVSLSDTPLSPSPTVIPAERTRYAITAYLDYTAHAVSVGEAITYPNLTGTTLGSLVLSVEPNLWRGGFVLDSLSVDGQAAYGYTLTAGRLEIPLPAPLPPNGTVVLSISYRLTLPYAGTVNIYGYNGLQANLLDWYPFVVPYDPAQGWLYHDPSTVGEHLVYDVADFDVTLQLNDYSLVAAASAPAEWTSAGWHYRLAGRTFVLSVSNAYQVESTAAGPIVVTSYYFGNDSGAGSALLQQVAKAVVTYGAYFAPYPYQSLSIVEAAVYPDGMEADGMFFLGRKFYEQYDGTVRNNLTTIGVHEAAHMWWFGLVGNDQAMEPWLDEAMAAYSEHIFYENNYPAYVNWWWGFRVNNYNPAGWVDNNIYNAGAFRTYVNSVYLNGANFMDALRLRIGDDAFLAFLHDYAVQMAGRRATADDFFRILRQHTAVDFSDIESEYFQYPR
jgi:Peptidase family M1 domain